VMFAGEGVADSENFQFHTDYFMVTIRRFLPRSETGSGRDSGLSADSYRGGRSWYTLTMLKVRLNLDKMPHANFPTRFGEFEIQGFENEINGEHAIALVKGEVAACDAPLVRIHSQCFTGDTLHSLRCDCGDQLEHALQAISRAKAGILIYQMQEGRGIGLINKLMAYQLQDQGIDTVEANIQLGFNADERDYEFCAEILKYLEADSIRLMSNNPDKIQSLESYGIRVVERIPLIVQSSPFCRNYMMTKKVKMGHLL